MTPRTSPRTMRPRAARNARATLLAAVLLLGPDPAALAERPSTPQGPLGDVDFYAVCYDRHPDPDLLTAYDMVVLDPRCDIGREVLSARDTVFLGYLSIGEAAVEGDESTPPAAEPWIEGKNPNWDSYYVDPAHPGWQERVLGKADAILDQGYAGLFLDTLDTVDALAQRSPGEAERYRAGMVRLVRRIREHRPDIPLVCNRGFSVLEEIAPSVDGLLVESLYRGYDFEEKRYAATPEAETRSLLARIEAFRRKRNLPVFVLDYCAPDQQAAATASIRRARSEGLVPYVAGLELAEVRAWTLRPVLRKVLGLYDATEGSTPLDNDLFLMVKRPLEQLGLDLVLRDVSAGLPPDDEMEGYRGIVTWFNDEKLADPAAFLDWIGRQVDAGRRYVMMGSVGAASSLDGTSTRKACEVLLGSLGIRREWDGWTNDPAKMEIVVGPSALIGYEAPVTRPRAFFQALFSPEGVPATRDTKHEPEPARNRIHLRVARTDRPGLFFDPVVTAPWGGAALSPYVYFTHPEGYRLWLIDPFAFFREALGWRQAPAADPTVLQGERVFYAHIDGDGFINLSEVRRGALSGEIVLERILSRYDLPFTVSVIVGEIAPEGVRPDLAERCTRVARRIYDLPNVEPATHTFSHPFFWDKTNERKMETYGAHNLDLPDYQYSLESEIQGSVDYIQRFLLPRGERVPILLWTGDCQPTREALAACDDAGILNLNGGESKLDPAHPSFSCLSPLFRRLGPYVQVYTSNVNENLYTNLWTGPFWGYRNVVLTFEQTARPPRTNPVNVYFHFYSGEKWASLRALEQALDWAREHTLAPVFASQYARQVLGFIEARLWRLDDGAWRVTDTGACATVRFDGMPDAYPDLKRCRGVLGYRHDGETLYLHLDDRRIHDIRLCDTPARRAHVKRATHAVRDWRVRSGEITFRTGGVGPARIVLGAVPVRSVRKAIVTEEGGARRTIQARGDKAGDCVLSFRSGREARVSVLLKQAE